MCEAPPVQFQPLAQFEISAPEEQKTQIRQLALQKEAIVAVFIEQHPKLAQSYIDAVDKDIAEDTRENSSGVVSDFFQLVENNPFSSPGELALYMWNFREVIRDQI